MNSPRNTNMIPASHLSSSAPNGEKLSHATKASNNQQLIELEKEFNFSGSLFKHQKSPISKRLDQREKEAECWFYDHREKVKKRNIRVTDVHIGSRATCESSNSNRRRIKETCQDLGAPTQFVPLPKQQNNTEDDNCIVQSQMQCHSANAPSQSFGVPRESIQQLNSPQSPNCAMSKRMQDNTLEEQSPSVGASAEKNESAHPQMQYPRSQNLNTSPVPVLDIYQELQEFDRILESYQKGLAQNVTNSQAFESDHELECLIESLMQCEIAEKESQHVGASQIPVTNYEDGDIFQFYEAETAFYEDSLVPVTNSINSPDPAKNDTHSQTFDYPRHQSIPSTNSQYDHGSHKPQAPQQRESAFNRSGSVSEDSFQSLDHEMKPELEESCKLETLLKHKRDRYSPSVDIMTSELEKSFKQKTMLRQCGIL